MSASISKNMKMFCVSCQRFLQRCNVRRFSDGRGYESTMKGWIRHMRKQKHVNFIQLNDGTGKPAAQIVTSPEICSKDVTEGSCITAYGKYQESIAQGQSVEFLAEEIKVHGPCNMQKYPFQPRKIHSHEHLRQFLHLRPKTALTSAVLRIRNTATMAVHKYFQENGYIFIHTPILSSNDCEGAGQLFTVKVSEKNDDDEKKLIPEFFTSPVFLTVSGQLHLEAVASGISKVYTFSPAFRAERSQTSNHLAEFYMIEAELSFTECLEDIMQVMEGLVKSLTREVMETSADDIRFVHRRNSASSDLLTAIDDMINKEFIRLPYVEALNIVNKICESPELKVGNCDFIM
eukprot:XP_019919938.1 PREDICTED: probable asparagine--tRNA ligase, mitochondrial [Crassostrea gigas]